VANGVLRVQREHRASSGNSEVLVRAVHIFGAVGIGEAGGGFVAGVLVKILVIILVEGLAEDLLLIKVVDRTLVHAREDIGISEEVEEWVLRIGVLLQ